MNLLRSFRFSTYCTVGIASISLGYSESGLLPEIPWVTGLVLIMLLAAYQIEGRWALSLRAANVVGAFLALALVAWISFQFVRKPTGALEFLPFPISMLPYLGPVLLILIPAKLFRPKHDGDYWAIHGIAMLAMALGCSMANDGVFVAFLIAYVFALSWSLTLFYMYREIQPRDGAPPPTRGPRLRIARLAAVWSVGIMLAGFLLFAATPRPSEGLWELNFGTKRRIEVGGSDANVDLNTTGTLQNNNEMAFEVFVQNADGTPKLDFNLEQKWYVSALNYYESGKWLRDRSSGMNLLNRAIGFNPMQKQDLPRWPDLGPNPYFIRYQLHRKVGGSSVTTYPALYRSGEPPPVSTGRTLSLPATQNGDGNFEITAGGTNGRATYQQICIDSPEPDLSPPMRLGGNYMDVLTRLPQPLEDRLRYWTSRKLDQLADEGKLPRAARTELDPFRGLPAARHHEAIARALEQYLATSTQFRYTTELERRDRNIDPIEDFLYNTRAGHCQRFATALALILRTQGIPTQLIRGYRGCEARGDGNYDIREYHAHAWVAALIERTPPASVLPRRPNDPPWPPGARAYHWLSLDPTPPGLPETPAQNESGNWFTDTLAMGENFLRNLIHGVDFPEREKAIAAVAETVNEFGDSVVSREFTWTKGLIAGGVLAVLGVVYWRRRRRLRRHADAEREQAAIAALTPFHARLLAVLARLGLRPGPGQTAREFAVSARELLRTRQILDELADVPIAAADAYYRVRFGFQHLESAELEALDAAVGRLETAIADRVAGSGG